MAKRLTIDVDHIAPAKRLRAWKDLLHDNFMSVDCRADAESLHGSISGCVIDGGSISRSSVSNQLVSRTQSLINEDGGASAIVALVKDGTFALKQNGHVAAVGPGDICVIDASHPFEARFLSDVVSHGLVCVPKAAITKRIGPTDDAAFGAFRAGTPLQKLVSSFLDGLTSSFDTFDPATLNRLLDQSLDLMALMIAEGRKRDIAPSTHRAAMILRVRAYIDANLKNPDLSIEKASGALGISSRYINTLLSEEGTSFGRYMLARRLDGARRDILDPRRIHRQVTEIALDWGFANPSHFGRVYKGKFGAAPREGRTTGGST